MSDVAIRVEGLGKRYRIGQQERYKALRDTLTDTLYAPYRALRNSLSHWERAGVRVKNGANGADPPSTFWALKDVSFEIKRGEVVGIIGRNGAGKSTLLKILSRITEPTEGLASINGRVGSLLEVGTGFHPELSGRENIYLNGAILGMKKAEIDRKFDEIVAFAEVEQFIDTPVKHYSSGMHMRLAFSVAAHLEPEILIVDEVLAVGDAAFQKKCLGKMGDVAREGRTVLLVSHNMVAVQNLCRRGVWLDHGRVAGQGDPGSVIAEYLRTATASYTEQVWPDIESAPGNESVRLHGVRLRADDDTPPDEITVHTPLNLEIAYWNLKPQVRLNLSLVLYNQDGTCVFASPSLNEPNWHGRAFPAGLFSSSCRIPGDFLNDGMYRAALLVVQDTTRILYHHEDALVFEIHDTTGGRGDWYGDWIGAVRPRLSWHTEWVRPLEIHPIIGQEQLCSASVAGTTVRS